MFQGGVALATTILETLAPHFDGGYHYDPQAIPRAFGGAFDGAPAFEGQRYLSGRGFGGTVGGNCHLLAPTAPEA